MKVLERVIEGVIWKRISIDDMQFRFMASCGTWHIYSKTAVGEMSCKKIGICILLL